MSAAAFGPSGAGLRSQTGVPDGNLLLNETLIRRYRAYSRLAAGTSIAIGLTVLLGWWLGIGFLKNIVPGLPTMKANTAVGFVATGLALWLVHPDGKSASWRRVGAALGLFPLIIGAATLLEYSGWNLRIDELLVKDDVGALATSSPGRPSPSAALIFMLLGAGLLVQNLRIDFSEYLGLLSLVVSTFGLLGYLYGATIVRLNPAYSTLALHTAITAILISLALVLMHIEAGPLAIFASTTPGGVLLRRLVPTTVAFSIFLGWACIRVGRAGLIEYPTAFVAAATLTSGFVVMIAAHLSATLNRVDRERRLRAAAAERAETVQRSVFDHAPEAIILANAQGRIERANEQAAAVFGYPVPEMLTMEVGELMAPEVRQRHAQNMRAYFAAPQRRAMSQGKLFSGRRKSGEQFPLEIMLSPLKLGEATLVVATARDVSEREKAAAQLRELALHNSLALRSGAIGIWAWDVRNQQIRWDAQMHAIYGIPPQHAVVYSTWRDAVLPEDRQAAEAVLRATVDNKAPSENNFRIRRGDGSVRYIRAAEDVVLDSEGAVLRVVGINMDVTDQVLAQQAVKAALDEKEVLLREVYHRVKNNLQVVGSLFNLQLRGLAPGPARVALAEAAERVQAMALVHEKLYQSSNLASIRLDEYIRDLCQRLTTSMAARERGIALAVEAEPIELGLESAVPLGLVLNELVGNSLKHAFPQGRAGTVRIGLERKGDDVQLTVADDGVGLPAGFDLQQVKTLGLKLVSTLSQQLEGQFVLKTDGGVRAVLSFRLHGGSGSDAEVPYKPVLASASAHAYASY